MWWSLEYRLEIIPLVPCDSFAFDGCSTSAPQGLRRIKVSGKIGILSALTFHRGDYRGFQRMIHFPHHQLVHRLMTSLSSSWRGVLVWQWQCLGRRNTHRHSGHTVPQASRLLDVCHTHNSQHYYHHNTIIFIIIMIFFHNRSKLNRKWKIVPAQRRRRRVGVEKWRRVDILDSREIFRG